MKSGYTSVFALSSPGRPPALLPQPLTAGGEDEHFAHSLVGDWGGGCVLLGGQSSPRASQRGSQGLKAAASGVLQLRTMLLSTGMGGPSTKLLF